MRPDPKRPLSRGEHWRQPAASIDGLFRRAAQQFSDEIALRHGKLCWTYGQLAQLSDQVATRMLALTGSNCARPVLIHARRSAMLVVAVLAAVRAGRTFAVIDSAYPADRIQRQAVVLAPGLVVGIETDHSQLERVYAPCGDLALLNLQGEAVSDGLVTSATPDAAPNKTAYMLFTSGTTGTPKCIQTGHAPLLHFIDFYIKTFKPGRGDRFSMLSGLGHDPFLRDVFVPLSCGAQICIPDEGVVRAPLDLYEWILASDISYLHATPQLIKLIGSGRGHKPPLPELRFIFSGGDVLQRGHVKMINAAAPNATVVNFYGSSETPQAMGFHVVEGGDAAGAIPLGQGIDDVQLLVLREDLSQADIGQEGQIGIRTHFLSDGYVGDDNATQDKYIPSPFGGEDGARIYLTGDQGYCRSDGAVMGAGRRDEQVKLRGYRVELGEVSRAIERSGLASDAALLVHATKLGENQLVGFVVPSVACCADDSFLGSLRTALHQTLPAYAVPARLIPMDSIPISLNGKVDRQALAALLAPRGTDGSISLRQDPELDDRLRTLIGEIEDTLEVTVDRLDRSFVDLGGDSLSYMQVSILVEDLFGRLPDDWETRPLSDFALVAAEEMTVKQGSNAWVRLELAILLRCVSIILVVVSHAEVGLDLAATAILFVVSGINFARFLAPAIHRTGSIRPALRFVAKIALPAGLWQLLRSFWMHSLWLPNLLLVGTFFQNPNRPVYTFWYLDVLAANVLLIAMLLVLRVRSKRSWPVGVAARGSFAGSILLLSLALVLGVGQVYSGWWDGELGEDSVAPFKWLWLLVLGITVANADTPARKCLASAIATGLGVSAAILGDTISGQTSLENGFFVAAVLLLIWVQHVPAPRWLQRLVMVVASATLFIYIVNYSVIYHLMPRLGLPAWLPLQVGMALAVGIGLSRLWDLVPGWTSNAFAKLAASRRSDRASDK